MTTTEDDAIEILSCHIEHEDLVVEPTTTVSISVKSKFEDDPATRHRKRVARAVAVVSFMLLLFSVVLIGVSLNMSKNIDELVRESNDILRRHNGLTINGLNRPKIVPNPTKNNEDNTIANKNNSDNNNSNNYIDNNSDTVNNNHTLGYT